MIEALKQLQNAMAYAQFTDKEIKQAALQLLKELDTELTAEDYEPGTAIEEAAATLETALNNTDSRIEDASIHSNRIDEEDDENPLAGFGDDEEEEK